MNEHWGIIGLGVMGRSLALNLTRQDLAPLAYSYSAEEIQHFRQMDPASRCADSLPQLINGLATPRVIMLMVTAGDAVDQVLADLKPLLQAGDIVIDGGNSHYQDTQRRERTLQTEGIHFIGTGISGGEAGALEGASLMAGGDHHAFLEAEPMLAALAAVAAGEPCYGWMGKDGAGHFVKMVHNGIEYAMMQLIAETWDLMHRGLGLSEAEAKALFNEWKQGRLGGYLVEITADILGTADPESSQTLLTQILDQAGQKGTGRWTLEAALLLGCPVPTIMAAVTERQISARGELRQKLHHGLTGSSALAPGETQWPEVLEATLYASFLVSFSQGLELIAMASDEYDWQTDLSQVIGLWRGGCIIRANLLEKLRSACSTGVDHLLLAPTIRDEINTCIPHLRESCSRAIDAGIPVPALSASLAYLSSLASHELPTSLIQAQRDYFGAHTFARRDKPGKFHHNWDPS